jgi:hypothetical protein
VSAETTSTEPEIAGVRAPEPASSQSEGTEVPPAPDPESKTLTIQPPDTGLPVSGRSPYRAVENAEGATEVTAAGQSLDEPQAPDGPQTLDELQADAQDALRAAAADPSYNQPETYNQTGDTVPTHHG